ncbi:hypothetical protein FRA_24c01040 [Francisella sp. W12-1067]|nr:hypothetical protein FRA_24c01040 [Francisella sp. W12-1067]
MKKNILVISTMILSSFSFLLANDVNKNTINITEFQNNKNEIKIDGNNNQKIIVAISEANGKNKFFREFEVTEKDNSKLLNSSSNINADISVNRSLSGNILVTNNTDSLVVYKYEKDNGGFISVDVPAHQTTGGGIILKKVK